MTQNIHQVMKSIVAVQERVSISSPEPRTIARAYMTGPHQGQSLTMPCFTNSWDFVGETRNGMVRYLDFVVNMRLHVARAADGDNSKHAEIATAFLDPILTAFGKTNANTGLGGIQLKGDVAGSIVPTATYTNIRGGTPTLAVFGDGDSRTVGLDLLLEVRLTDAFDYS